jgi:type IV secretory pathway protease TraF
MLPFLRPGNIILASSLANVAIGKVVIILDDGIEKIKRVDKIDGRKVFLLGDNPNSSKDSRHFGWLPSSRILASVIWPKS